MQGQNKMSSSGYRELHQRINRCNELKRVAHKMITQKNLMVRGINDTIMLNLFFCAYCFSQEESVSEYLEMTELLSHTNGRRNGKSDEMEFCCFVLCVEVCHISFKLISFQTGIIYM